MTGAPIPHYSPKPTPTGGARSWPWGLISGVLAGSLVVGAAFGAFTGAVTGAFVSAFPAPPDQPLLEGEPGNPDAVVPLECEGQCFTEASAEEFSTDDAIFDTAGLVSESAPWNYTPDSPVRDLYPDDLDYWEDYANRPDECFFTVTLGPYSPRAEHPDSESEDLIHFLVAHEDQRKIDMAQMSARLFASNSDATTYLHDLASSIAECSSGTMSFAGDRGQVSPLAALDVPDSVAAVGWVLELSPGWGWRTYGVDLQRGNAIVRIQVGTDGTVTEQQFRELVETYAADDLAMIAPTT